MPKTQKKGSVRPYKTRKKRTNTKQLIDKCDALWAFLIKRRANFQCEVCGREGEITSSGQFAGYRTKGLEAHHLVSKGGNSYLRHNIDNGMCLCHYHHKYCKDIVAHGAMEAVHNLLKYLELYYQDRWKKYLENKDKKYTDKTDYDAKLNELQNMIKEKKNVG